MAKIVTKLTIKAVSLSEEEDCCFGVVFVVVALRVEPIKKIIIMT